MAGFSTYLAQAVIAATTNNSALQIPYASLYLALFTSDPTDDYITANEATGSWYARVATGAWSSPIGSGVATSNSGQIAFAAVTGSAITISHWGICDNGATGGGHLLYSGALTTPKVLNVGDIMTVAAAALELTFA